MCVLQGTQGTGGAEGAEGAGGAGGADLHPLGRARGWEIGADRRRSAEIGAGSQRTCIFSDETPPYLPRLARAFSRSSLSLSETESSTFGTARGGRRRPRRASKLLRRRSGVRRSGLSPRRHPAGGWGGVVRQRRRHLQPAGRVLVVLAQVEVAREPRLQGGQRGDGQATYATRPYAIGGSGRAAWGGRRRASHGAASRAQAEDDDPLPRPSASALCLGPRARRRASWAHGAVGSRRGGLTARWARPHEGGVKRAGCSERGRTGSAGAP